jgi:hypothetical protein
MKSKIITSCVILLMLPLAACGRPYSLVRTNPENVPDDVIEKALKLCIEKYSGVVSYQSCFKRVVNGKRRI